MESEFRIEGVGVSLRDFRRSDSSAVHAIIGDDRITAFLSFDSRSLDDAVSMLERTITASEANPRTEFYLAIVEDNNDDVIGFVRLALTGVKAAKLGYAVASARQGKGIATRAADAMISFGFNSLSLHRITAAVGPDNSASLKVLKSLGFGYEGRLRDHVYTNQAWRDSLLFSRLSTD